MGRKFNFGAGPATMPLPVLEEVQSEMLDWKGLGLSVMEISHRSDEFQEIAKEAEADFRAGEARGRGQSALIGRNEKTRG